MKKAIDDARERASEIADQLSALGPIGVARFFGGAGLKADGVQFAFVINGTLYFRTDEGGRATYEALGSRPFRYDGRSGEVVVTSYWEVPSEILEDEEELGRWAGRAIEAARAPRPARGRRARRAG